MPEIFPYDKTEEGGIELAMLFRTNRELAKQIMQASRKNQNNEVPDKSVK
ncbi:hypothetical protein KKF38_00040 [Patescibacteria group bacterium]|nr:hypothetical protein [Patescibacteria group bacterium]